MMTGGRLALLIGTDAYQDHAFGQLRAPRADVAALQAVLADPAIGQYEVGLLSNAASHQVNQAIERFFAEASRDDLVLLYFSGHGFKDDAGRLYLITNDSRKKLLGSTAVSAQFVREQLDRCRSRRKVVILDCCYAGAFPHGTTRGADTVNVLEGLGGRGSAVITASSALEYAFENDTSLVSTVGDAATPSVFTTALIDGLATGGADRNGDGLIDIDELYDYVYRQVRENFQQQTPGRRSDVEGALYVAASPRGPQPAELDPEIIQAIQHPLTSVRLAIVNDLYKLCSGTHPGIRLAARNALDQLTDDDSRGVSEAARSARDRMDKHADQRITIPYLAGKFIHQGAHKKDTTARSESDYQAVADSDDILAAAVRDGEAIRTTARREVEELTAITLREVAKLRTTADHEVAEKRAAAERDIAELRTVTEREVAQLKASAKREGDEILTTSKRHADEMRSQAQRILEESTARANADPDSLVSAAWREASEIRSQAQRILEESKGQAEAEADRYRAEAREEAERILDEGQKQAERMIKAAREQAERAISFARSEVEKTLAAAHNEAMRTTG